MPRALDPRSALTLSHHNGYGLEKPDPRPAIYHSEICDGFDLSLHEGLDELHDQYY